MPTRPGAAPAAAQSRELLHSVLASLDSASVRWCLLRGGAGGVGPGQDVDLLVARPDLPRALTALRGCGMVPLPAYGRASHQFFLGFDHRTGSWLELDVVTELAYGPHFCVSTRAEDDCLAAARRRDGGAWTLRRDDEFWALLLHCVLDKGAVSQRHAEQLGRLAASASLESPLVRAWPEPAGCFAAMLAAARVGDWTAVVRQREALLSLWWRTHRLEATRRLVRGALLRAAERPLQAWSRRGASVALLGPDGAGKSTVAEGIESRFYFPVQRVYMGLWARRETLSGRRVILEVALRPLVIWRRYLGSLRHRALGRLVVFDRYVYDAMLPPSGPLVRLKRLYFRLLSRLCPAPDLVLVLDVPGGVMHARKAEHSAERLEAEREAFLRLLRRLPNAERVDADRPPEVLLADVLGRIWRRYAARTSGVVAR
jgi:thymidylate kinase